MRGQISIRFCLNTKSKNEKQGNGLGESRGHLGKSGDQSSIRKRIVSKREKNQDRMHSNGARNRNEAAPIQKHKKTRDGVSVVSRGWIVHSSHIDCEDFARSFGRHRGHLDGKGQLPALMHEVTKDIPEDCQLEKRKDVKLV